MSRMSLEFYEPRSLVSQVRDASICFLLRTEINWHAFTMGQHAKGDDKVCIGGEPHDEDVTRVL